MIGFSPRRSLTAHQDWKEVLETLRAKFHTYVTPKLLSRILLTSRSVKLPKSFVAIDLSEKEAFERRGTGIGNGNGLKKETAEPEVGERGRSEERRASADAEVPKSDPALGA